MHYQIGILFSPFSCPNIILFQTKTRGVGSISSKDVVIWVQIIYLVDDFVISFLFYLIWVQKINLVDITNYDYECHLLCSLFFFSFCVGEEGCKVG